MDGTISDYIHRVVQQEGKYNKIVARFKRDKRLEEVTRELTTLSASILFDYVYPDKIPVCSYGNRHVFKNFVVGYTYCGKSNVCACLKEHVSDSVKSTKARFSKEQKENILEKAQETFIQRYGVTNPLKSADIRDKIKSTNLARYGETVASKSDAVKVKVAERNLLKYKNGHHTREHIPELDIDDIVSKYQTSTITELAGEIGIHYQTLSKIFNAASVKRINHSALRRSRSTTSVFEQEVAEYIRKLTDNVVMHHRIRGDQVRELDIYVPDKSIAVECNGSYWHSELNGKDRFYHLKKTEMCAKQGIQLIHIWEHDWNSNQPLVKERLKSKLGIGERIYARLCDVNVIDAAEKNEFLERVHIQGTCPSSINYGLYYNGKLVAVMTFGKSRYDKKISYELLRYASIGNIVGGASRLFKRFEKDHAPESVVSYADRMWNTGGVYEKLGFGYSHSTDPAYYYTKDYITFENRVKYQKHKLPKLLEDFDVSLTEWENMKINGYDRIWDCGTAVYKWYKNANRK